MSNVLGPLLFVATAIGLYFTYIGPAYDTLNAFKEQDEKLTQAITDFGTLEGKRADLLAKHASFSTNDLNRLEQILPDSLDYIDLLIDINTLVLTNGLTVDTYDFDGMDLTPKNNGSDDEIPMVQSATLGIEMHGPYENMKAFLRNIESSLTLLDVVELEVKAEDQDTDEQGDPKYNIVVQMYWLQ